MTKRNNVYEKEKAKTFALAGNPNVGKSTVFNCLTGLRHHTGNWAGKTVANTGGRSKKYGDFYLQDLPGCYSLSARSPEEETARDYIQSGEADAIIVIADGSCLERSLYLVIMTMEITSKVVLGVNMLDEAEKRHVEIDIIALEKLLGIPVAGICGKKGKGLKELIDKAQLVSTYSDEPHTVFDGSEEEKIRLRVEKAHSIASITVKSDGNALERDIKADKILTGKLFAFPVMLLLLALVFFITLVGANYPSEWLTDAFGFLGKSIRYALEAVGADEKLISLLINGIYNSLTWVIAVMLPPMAIFFPLFTFLEDIGYLPRIAYNLDKSFSKCTSCGKQAITMCMGLGCTAVGVTGCRIIDSPHERLIAIITNCFVPCNGKFPSLMAVITMFLVSGSALLSSAVLTVMIVICVAMTLAMSKILSKTLLKGIPSEFTLELPPYRKPAVAKVLVRSILDRTLGILGKAAAVAAPAGLVIWLLCEIRISDESLLKIFSDTLHPIAKVFGLDGVILTAFILGLPANEIVLPIIVMTYTSQSGLLMLPSLDELGRLLAVNGWTGVTPLCFALFMMFHSPCSTAILTVYKETKSIRWTAVSIVLPAVTGLALCFVVNAVYKLILAI